jgi:hypothetical protein
MTAWWLGARGTAPRLRRLAPASRPRVVQRRARSGGRSASMHHRPTLLTLRQSSSYGRSSAITAPRSTGR